MHAMESLADLQRAFFDGLYTNRIPVAIGSIVIAVVVLVIAWRAGWFAAARRHPGRSGVLLVAVLAVGLPLTWYLASPIWIRTELIEPEPAAEVVATAAPTSVVGPRRHRRPRPPSASAAPSASGRRGADPVRASHDRDRRVPRHRRLPLRSRDRHGSSRLRPAPTPCASPTSRSATAPTCIVYLSPDADDYVDGALELGLLKATDGAFGYELPAGTDPADFASAIIWCKQFSHLFAVAPLDAG